MTGTLKALRTEIVDKITTLTTYDHIPARAVLPCAFIHAGTPYLEPGQTIGSRRVRFGITILTGPSFNAVETDELDAWIEQIQNDLEADGWVLGRVEQPVLNDFNGVEALATTINVACDATF